MKTHMKIAKGARKQNSPIARIEDALDAFREGSTGAVSSACR